MGQQILLVEDSSDDELLTLRALRKNNFAAQVVIVHDGQEALDYLFSDGEFAGRETFDQPNMVLLDINLPKLNGLEVLKQVRSDQRTRYLPIVMLTSSSEESDIRSSYDDGANSYVLKSIDFKEFSTAMAYTVQYWLAINMVPGTH